MFKSFREILDLWATLAIAADEIGAPRAAVAKWYQRDKIPSEYWGRLIVAAEKLGHALTAENLTAISATKLESAAA